MILEGEVERLCWEKLKKYNFCKIEPGENEKKMFPHLGTLLKIFVTENRHTARFHAKKFNI